MTENPPSIMRVSHLLDQMKGISCEDFVALYPHPWLVAQGEATSSASNDEFLTRPMQFISELIFNIKGGLINPNARVFPLVKQAGVNSYSKMIIIGRGPKSDILLESPAVSKMQAYITWTDSPEGKTHQFVDGNSSNGTWINAIKLVPHKPHDLENGDVVGLSGAIFLRFLSSPDLFAALLKLVH
jgi:hypothetical protein